MINLLPPEQKQILLREKQFKKTLILGFIVIFSFSLFCLILLAIQLDLSGKLIVQKKFLDQKNKEFEISEIKGLEKEVDSANKTLLRISSFYQDEFYLTDIVNDFLGTIPSGIYLTTFSFNRENKEFVISGFSPDRDTLIKFKENLENNGNFKEIFLPASSWVKPEDITFSVTFKITK